MITTDYLLLIFAYLLGSIPTSVWVGKWACGIDIREHGSGNAGATNTVRVLGYKWGIPVLLFDILKGFLAVSLIQLSSIIPETELYHGFSIILGIMAVVGHIWPIFANFKGGKGVATILGVVMAMQLLPTLIAFAVFILILLTTRYVSVGSILASISYPISVFFLNLGTTWPLVVFSIAVPLLLIFTHRANIKRLWNGNENKADFLFKKKKE